MEIPVDTRIAKLEADVVDLQERVKQMNQIARSDALAKAIQNGSLLTMALGFALGLLFCSIVCRLLPG